MDFLFSNQKNIFNATYFKIIIYAFSAFIYAHFSGLSVPDDGLRHIAFAAHPDIMHSWGDVFPHSLFFKEYDPWFVWHKIIALYLHFFSYENVHIAINTTVLFILMNLLDALLLKFSTFKKSPLLIFIVLSVVLMSSFKYVNVRPDLLSGLFLMASLLLSRHIFFLFILTALYATTYYLFFLYTGSLGLLYIVLKNYKALSALFIGSLIGLAFHLYFGGEYYVDTIKYLLTDQTLREGLAVSEGTPFFEILGFFNYYVLVFLAWLISFTIIYMNYNYFKNQALATLILIMSPLWLAQSRYVLLIEPIFFLYLFIESKPLLKLLISKQILFLTYKFIHIIKLNQYKPIFLLPALLYTSTMFGYMMQEKDFSKTLEEKKFYQNKIFNNQTILLNSFTIDIYNGLYLNPTIKFIPSCSIGWFETNKKMKDIYIRMMKDDGISEEELNSLIEYTGAKYYLHFLKNPKQVLSFKKLHTLGIEPILILNDKILFEKRGINE